MTVLFLTTMMPGERVTGSEVVSATFVEAMRSAGERVVVLAYRRAGSSLRPQADEILVADRHIETKGAGPRPYWWLARALAERRPYSAAKYVTGRYRRAVASALAAHRPDLAVVDHAQMAWAVPRDCEVPLAYLAHNVENQLYSQAAESARWPMSWVQGREATRIRSVEKAIGDRASQVWALSQGDADALAKLCPGASPTVFELPATVEEVDAGSPRYDVATLGSWTWKANAAGLEWFVNRVVPLLPGGAEVGVAGAGAEQITAGRENVTYEGRVPNAAEFLAKARVIAVPSVAGAGVQIKTLDAIATGRPVVATPIALRGIGEAPPTVLAAEDPGEFAACVARQLEAPRGPDERAAATEWSEARRERFAAAVKDALHPPQREAVAA